MENVDDNWADGLTLTLLLTFTVFADVAFGAFIYKVWNERQQTHEVHDLAVQAKRIADATEARR